MGAKGSSIIGFAFAAAVGAKIAAAEKPIAAIIGDGGFLYSTQELSTCVRHGIHFPLIVVNSRSYGIIGYLPRTYFTTTNTRPSLQTQILSNWRRHTVWADAG